MMKMRLLIERFLFGTKLKQNKVQYFLLKKYYQWIAGQCRHLCCFCEFRKQCTINEDNYLGVNIDYFD